MAEYRFEPHFVSETLLQRISPKVIKVVDNPDHCNLEVSVKIVRRMILDVVAGEQEDGGDSVRPCRRFYYIHPSTYGNMNSLRIHLHDVLVGELKLKLGESDIVSVSEKFNSLMMMFGSCHEDDEHTTVVVAEFEKRELYRSYYLRADLIMRKRTARVEFSVARDSCNSNSTCVICLDEFADESVVVKMPCEHIFHELCLRKWLNKKNACPMCRAPIQVID